MRPLSMTMALSLDTPVQYVKGVGPRRAQLLASAGIHVVEDLLKYAPFRYEDRTRFRRIAQLRQDEEAVVQAVVRVTGRYTTPMKKVGIFEMVVGDDSGMLGVKFFNQTYLERVFRKGQQVILYGAPRYDSYSGGLGLINPEYEILEDGTDASIHSGRVVPVYRRIGALTTKNMRQILFQLLLDLEGPLSDPLPRQLTERHSFPGRRESFQQLHFPDPPADEDRESWLEKLHRFRAPFQQRFIFEEFFVFQLGLQMVKKRRHLHPKHHSIGTNERIRETIKSILPFRPTQAQKRVFKDIVDDLKSGRSMHRLLQGDVGSGKTIVALQAIVVVVENGYQAALMAPTEILAEQHHRNVTRYLESTPYRVALLTSSVKGKARKAVLEAVAAGEVHLLVGTHALIQTVVQFRNLALIVIDEQHRFGVLQRLQLMDKGQQPDTLVMTATPIPRSLALTLYGDLDLSVIDEMPPGRQAIKTFIKSDENREEVYRLLRQQLRKGRQAYVVYPLVQESEKIDLRAATEMASHLQQDVFPEWTVGLMHGKLKAEEKEALMQRFQKTEIHILVSTTVIEVGIDIPNATLMVIEHAERFGLSQLHQLRGRIGRGEHSSTCVLMTPGARSREAYERLDIMRRTNDGFLIAEKDLAIRGPGDFLGTRQSGIPEFLFGNIVRDRDLLETARADAEEFLQGLGGMEKAGEDQYLTSVAATWKRKYGLYYVG
jgi:ATP-dependent DNA helicase RecG